MFWIFKKAFLVYCLNILCILMQINTEQHNDVIDVITQKYNLNMK